MEEFNAQGGFAAIAKQLWHSFISGYLHTEMQKNLLWRQVRANRSKVRSWDPLLALSQLEVSRDFANFWGARFVKTGTRMQLASHGLPCTLVYLSFTVTRYSEQLTASIYLQCLTGIAWLPPSTQKHSVISSGLSAFPLSSYRGCKKCHCLLFVPRSWRWNSSVNCTPLPPLWNLLTVISPPAK